MQHTVTDRLLWPGQYRSAPPRVNELSRVSWKDSPVPTQSSFHSRTWILLFQYSWRLGSQLPSHSVQRRNIWREEVVLLRDPCLQNTATSRALHCAVKDWMVQLPLPALPPPEPRVPGRSHSHLPVGLNQPLPALGSSFPWNDCFLGPTSPLTPH